ncbi:hypothetical protein [Shewanella violacea]|uniref:Uncharacterized protein n=1 Tax=Shewanella violacea (strain JCM 10179 / CIP 106290 / LMG 19151 / DSS12) TaxID=637905 RepID=D4ZBE6_SHEVD|nr:hypothetical protein [Shewanella violacea]BAJ03341.1 hypothetical protein SVI_3370 [Shewanella violacea DSS12]
MIKLHGLSDAEYIRLRYEFIKLFEGSTTKVYDDGIGLPTIGIGFNLQLEENLEALLKEGFGVNSINMGAALIEMNQAISDIETYVQIAKANGTYTASSSTIEMRKILTDHWRTFKSDPNAEFTLTDTLNGATVDDKIANVFDIILNATGANPGYETIISQKMANVGVNKRRDSHIFCALTHPLLTFKLPQLRFVQDNDYDFSSTNPYRCRIDSVLPHNKSLC